MLNIHNYNNGNKLNKTCNNCSIYAYFVIYLLFLFSRIAIFIQYSILINLLFIIFLYLSVIIFIYLFIIYCFSLFLFFRIAMLAAVGWPASELFHYSVAKLFGKYCLCNVRFWYYSRCVLFSLSNLLEYIVIYLLLWSHFILFHLF